MCWLWSEGLRARALRYKTRACKYQRMHACPYGMSCHYAHGARELRMPADNEEHALRVKWTYLYDCGYENED